jgi:DEAD/DEAH box helicase domain-containing protein
MSKKDFQVEKALDDILRYSTESLSGTKVVKIEEFSGRFSPYPDNLSPEIVKAYLDRGVDRLYSHQAEGIDKVLQDKNIVVATPTASGKTLIYNSIVLNSILQESSSKSLYLFPTKALSQDQLAELLELNGSLKDRFGLYTYDGDTAQSKRQAIRKKAQIVLTNPYMLHSGILPHHTKWVNLFENLKYIIIDELHYYTGVFGSHMANIIRRLKRICAFYGSRPIFIMSSATISNPRELGEKIIEEPVDLIENSGAPRGLKYLIFINPPMVNRELGIRKSYMLSTRAICNILLNNDLQTIVFTNSRLRTEILVKYLKNDFEKKIGDEGKIRGYRGGYLPGKRREIEQLLRQGKVRGVVSTNALELGIDIGSLDAAVLAAYPGTIASTWQRLGRAGRRSNKSIGVVVCSSSPTNQFIVNHPQYFTDKSPETGRINPNNIMILLDHIKCAAFELPFREGEEFGQEDLLELLNYLSENDILLKRGEQWFWTEEGYPADSVSLTRVSSDNFVVVDRTGQETVIAEVAFSSAVETLHPRAIYILEGVQYIVEAFDYENRKAFVKKSDADYYTDSVTYSKVSVLDVFDDSVKDNYSCYYGDVQVKKKVVGFKKIKFFTNENVGSGELELPENEMHTTAFWFTINRNTIASIDLPADEKIEALSGIAYLMRHLASVLLMCNVNDLGIALEDNITKTDVNHNQFKNKIRNFNINSFKEFEPNIYIFDNYPSGIGLSETLYEKTETLLSKTLETILKCECQSGCPSCVGPNVNTKSRHKEIAGFILKTLLSLVYN